MKTKNKFLVGTVIILVLSSFGCSESNDSAIKLIPVKSGKDFQYIDQEGKIVINPQFSEASVFRNNLALVKTSGENPKWGFISEDGKYAIMPTYKSATVFNEDLAWVVSENGSPTAINKNGEIKITLQDAEEVRNFNDGLAAYSIIERKDSSGIDIGGIKWGLVDKDGKVKINPQFSNVGFFEEGKCAVQNSEGKWGFIDKEGKLIINYQFEEIIEGFKNDKAVVSLNGKAGLIDDNGKYVINPQFSSMMNDGENYIIMQDGKFGWCDKEGKIIINPQFEIAFPFSGDELAAVKSGKSFGYINLEGKIIINPQFDAALPFNGNLALVMSSQKYGFIDKEGKYVINPQFDNIPEDLAIFLLNGSSEYNRVKTDYFNIGAIVSRINILTPEGLTMVSKISDVCSKFKKSETDFSQYAQEHQMISNEKITNDASLDFGIFADAFQEVPDGWYTKRVLNPNAIVACFVYTLNLHGNGYGKADALKTAIETTLTGYTKDTILLNEVASTYTNAKQSVIIIKENEEVKILIIPIPDTYNILEEFRYSISNERRSRYNSNYDAEYADRADYSADVALAEEYAAAAAAEAQRLADSAAAAEYARPGKKKK